LSRTFRSLASIALAALVPILLGSCSGAVGGPANATGGPITISPDTATLYSDLPTTFLITGGNGSYIITSSDQQAVPVVATTTSGAFTVVPNEVAADTPVILTVRDTGTSTPATANLTVKPRTVSNVVTVTPSASQSAACGTAICSGGDAEVKVVLAQGGVALVGRQVRFDVISGDIRIITSAPGTPEVDSLSGTTTTDNTGTASMRVRVLSDATSQTALLQVTDVSSGFTQRVAVTIAPSSNAPLNAQPNTIVFQGTTAGSCADHLSADVIVFGGRPPYLISQPGSFGVTPTVVSASGGRFTVNANGQCSGGSQIAVVDQNGATVSVTASNKLSDLPVPTPTPTTPPFGVSSSTVSLASCNSIANVTLSGGSGSYFGTSDTTDVLVNVNTNIGSISMNSPTSGTTVPTPAQVTFSDGQSSTTVTVKLGASITGSGC
jgi:hypothetical protein